MKINTAKVQKKVYSQSNENKRFNSDENELIEHIYTILATAGYFSGGIEYSPLRQIVDACVVTACNAISSFDDDRWGSDEDYADLWIDLNDKFQDHTSDLCGIFRRYK